MTTNRDVMAMLDELISLTTLEEESPQSFKVRAYENAKLGIDGFGEDVTALTVGELTKIKGVGKATATKIRELVDSGSVEKVDKLREKYPPEFLELTRIPGLGPKTVKLVRKKLGVENVEGLKAAIAEEKLRDLPGLGATSEAKISKAIERLGLSGKDRRTPIADAMPLAERLVADLRDIKGVVDVMYCGSLRRMSETIGDIDITVSSKKPAVVMDAVVAHDEVDDIVVNGETKTSFLTRTGLQVDVRVVEPDQFGAATLYFTGSKAHNIALRQRAIDRGLLLNEYGLLVAPEDSEADTAEADDADVAEADDADVAAPGKGDPKKGAAKKGAAKKGAVTKKAAKATSTTKARAKARATTKKVAPEVIASETEAAIYKALDLPYIAPAMRESTGEVEAAADGELPDLVQREHIHADLHYHTARSGDGRSSVEDMVAVAEEAGYDFLAITDHGVDLTINGSTAEEMLEHREHIAEVQKAHPDMLLMWGCELNIDATGGLDYDDDFRALFDYTVASVHSHYDQTPKAQTKRLVAAISDPTVNSIGHLSGRYIGRRPGIEFEVDEVLDALKHFDVALEVNGALQRLDAASDVVRRAVEREVKLVINTDSHHTSELGRMEYGVQTAQRGWAPKELVINTWPRKKFLEWVASRAERT